MGHCAWTVMVGAIPDGSFLTAHGSQGSIEGRGELNGGIGMDITIFWGSPWAEGSGSPLFMQLVGGWSLARIGRTGCISR